MSLHKEWATFIDPRDASTWQIDLTFLASAWKCIFGSGCKGIHGDAVFGCCSSGVFVKSGADDEDGGSVDDAPLDWWCVDSAEAYVGSQPVYRNEESLLRRILGDPLYEEVAAYMEERYGKPDPTPINWVGHWGVEPPDGSTSI